MVYFCVKKILNHFFTPKLLLKTHSLVVEKDVSHQRLTWLTLNRSLTLVENGLIMTEVVASFSLDFYDWGK